jgi:predicted nucleotidyltransferase
MRKEEVIARVKRHAEEIRALGVTELYLFGSTVRGEAREDSDVDFFIEYDASRRFSLFDLMHVEDYLAVLLGRKVDLGTKTSLHPEIRDEVIGEAVRVL